MVEMGKESIFTKGIKRRTFLKGAAAGAVITGVAVANSSGVAMKALATADAEQVAAAAKEEIFSGVCRPNCGGSCHLNVHVRGGKVVKTSMGQMPDPRYNRVCLRGLSHMQRIYNPNRIKYPMKRVGERGEGKWERISWDEAIATVTGELNRVRQTYGNSAVTMLGLSGNYGILHGNSGMNARLRNAIGATSMFTGCDMALPVGMRRVVGGPIFNHGNEPAGLVDSKTVIIWAGNYTESLIHNWHFVADAMDAGAKLVVIDPLFSGMAAKADLHVPVRPGSDIALVLAMIKIVIDKGWTDLAFMREHTVAPFLVRDDTKLFLRNSDLTGIPVAKGEPDSFIVWDELLAKHIALENTQTPALEGTFTINGIKVSTAFTLLKDSVQIYTPEMCEEMTDIKPAMLQELTQMYAVNTPSAIVPGFGCDHYDNGHHHAHAIATLASITGNIGKPGGSVGMYMPWGDVGNPVAVSYPAGKGGPTIPVLKLGEVMKTGKFEGVDFPQKALYVFCTNPVSNLPNQNEWLNTIIPGYEFIVVLDSDMNDTVKYADIVLPIAHWFEQEDFVVGGGIPFAVYQDKAVEPAFETKPDGEIVRLLAPGLGVEQYFQITDDEYMAAYLSGPAAAAVGLTLERLKKEKVVRHCKEPFIFAEGGNFTTPTGRAEFYVENPKPMVPWKKDLDISGERLATFTPPAEAWPDNPLREKYPLTCVQEHVRGRVHGQWFNVPALREIDPEPIVKINPIDAATRGIGAGDIVEVYNDRGMVAIKATINDSVRPGTVNIPKGWQREHFIAGGYQELTQSNCNPMTSNCSFFDILVEVRHYKGGK